MLGVRGAVVTSSAPVSAEAPNWGADAVATAQGLATRLRAGGQGCDDYEPWNYGMLRADLESKHIPVPRAVTACTTATAEDLTFEVFVDGAAKAAFVSAKRKLLCDAAARRDVPFPGFPYIDGGAWIIEPDEQATARALAPLVGGAAQEAGCD
jgi:hypothetical protein